MTEKRFIFVIDNGEYTFYDLSKNGEIMNMIDTEDMLNQLNKEIEQLQQRNKRLKEKIQRERTSFTKTHERWRKEAETKIKELSEENEYLKKRLNNVQKELFCKDRILEEKGIDIECCDEKDCGHCKHCQLDGMFGMWCDIHDDKFFHNVNVCLDFER